MGHAQSLAWLDTHRTPEGAWAYRPGGSPHGEPTLLAAAAGAPPPLDWLEETELDWAEFLVPAALDTAAEPAEEERLHALRLRALEALLVAKGSPAEPAGRYDGTLIGWAWVDGTFSWVQPTVWAMLSLRRLGRADHPRFEQALALIADRQGSDGGWNYGNPNVLDQDLPSYLYLTGWVLLALPHQSPMLEPGFTFLEGVVQTPSTTNLATAILARLAHGLDVAELEPLLRGRQREDGSFGPAIERTAIAACALRALETGVVPFAARPLQAAP